MTRRWFLTAAAATSLRAQVSESRASKTPPLGGLRGEFVRYLDPLTENPVVRLTAPTSAALFPLPSRHFVSSRSRFLIFSSNRGGSFAPFRLDLRTGGVQQLAETRKLQTPSLMLDAAERHLFYIDDGQFRRITLGGSETRSIAEGVSAFTLTGAGGDPVFIRDGKLQSRSGGVLADNASAPCLLSSDGARCLFARGNGAETEYWSVPAAGGKAQRIAQGAISFPFWSADSTRLLFLRQMPDTGVSEIREADLEGAEKLAVRTSRFGAFSPNHDDSVFVGASASKAQPLILLTLRSTQRELPLCEHHAGDAELATPVFSPDNRRVYFQSTRDGNSALYSVNTESFVEAAS